MPVPINSSVNSSAVAAVVRYALLNGLTAENVVEAIGYAPSEVFVENRRFPAIVGPKLLLNIVALGRSVAPPLELGASVPFSFFGGLENALLLSSSPRDGLQNFAVYFAIFHSGMQVDYSETKRFASFSYKYADDEFDNGCANEVVLAVLFRLMTGTFGESGRPHEVQTGYDPNGLKSVYCEAFGSPVRFASADKSFRLVFKRSKMSSATSGVDPELMKFAEKRLRQRLEDVQSSTLSLELRDLKIAAEVCVRHGKFSIEDVANYAEMSLRSAQRLSGDNDTSIRELINNARLSMLSERLISEPNCPAGELAELLGYSDERAFRRALLAWTGMSIAAFRKRRARAADNASLPVIN
ncbi:MAG: AraC family transcriptional regulator ligand-binding domain-containing protein [Pseudomonadota bacterium]